jgi:hypothetical protein
LNLVVRVRSFFSFPDGEPKPWTPGKTLPTQTVDIHNYSLLQLVDFIAERYMWGSKQHITLWRELECSMEIKSNEQLLEWFQLNIDKGVVHMNAQINDFVGPLQCSTMKRRCHPSVRNKAPITTNERATERPTNESCTNERATSTSKKKGGTKCKGKGGDGDEGVGVDEEGMYSNTDSLVVPSDSSYDSDLAASSDSDDDCSDPEFDPNGEVVDNDDEYDPPFHMMLMIQLLM